ncbi:heme-dependent oxidative N-demethylase family protein [Ilumatobacter sp.]|uniref:heme-dependent oxidative N-demethylase family protein n=1 Tax=Ilumatobacter sp. TaxID=1967498 RepID=UPI003B523A7E
MSTVGDVGYEPWAERGSVVDGAFRWRLGVRPLDLDDWIELGPDAEGPDGWIARTGELLDSHRSTVMHLMDDVDDECAEVARAVVHHLRRRWPGRFGDVEVDPDVHPLEAAARLVPEDLVLMVRRGGRLVFGGGVVCFPNRWDLASKLGRTMSEVHEPVAGLNDQLATEVDRFLDRLRPERSFWRLGWGIIDVADGYTPLDGTGPARPTDPGPEDLHVRVERETLRRFGATGCVLFTIRTHLTPLTTVAADRASRSALAGAIAAMGPEVRDYKGLGDAVTAALASAGAEDPAPASLV